MDASTRTIRRERNTYSKRSEPWDGNREDANNRFARRIACKLLDI